MRGKEIITKLIIPGAIAMIICLIVHPMCMNGEILDWRKLLLFVGIPFGIQKMFLLVVPRNVGTGEMLGLVVLDLCAAPGGKATELAAKLHGTEDAEQALDSRD